MDHSLDFSIVASFNTSLSVHLLVIIRAVVSAPFPQEGHGAIYKNEIIVPEFCVMLFKTQGNIL